MALGFKVVRHKPLQFKVLGFRVTNLKQAFGWLVFPAFRLEPQPEHLHAKPCNLAHNDNRPKKHAPTPEFNSHLRKLRNPKP